jgi:hypothetical protein
MDKDMERIAKALAKQAKLDKKQEIKMEKAIKKEEKIRAEIEALPQYGQAEENPVKSVYTAVVVAKLEYKDGEVPDEQKLAEDIARTIIKWADQKSIISIDPKEPVPILTSLDVDIQ